jgi:succinate dehydrogenase flavin-adding protein (antitoxin of CptAB toxin-antitoxin module)
MVNLPSGTYKYFWDVNPQTLDLEQHKTYIIERLLEQGDLDSLNWLNQNISQDDIKKTVKDSRRISAKTKNFFSLYYKLK